MIQLGRFYRWWSVLLLFSGLGFGVFGCGSGDGTGAGLHPTGTVALLLTDDPDPAFSEVNVTITRIELLSDHLPPVVLFEGARRVNLLALEDVEDLFLVGEGVPPGLYNKIRLFVSEPEFRLTDNTDVITSSQIQLVADGKIDLNPRHPFEVKPGETLMVVLDFDAHKSIKITETGKAHRYILRPVVFVKILDDFLGRLVQVRGKIIEIDPDQQTFVLERDRHRLLFRPDLGDVHDEDVHDDEGREKPDFDRDLRDHRITVRTDGKTRIFLEDGMPGDFNALEKGQDVIVRGFLRFEDGLFIQARLVKIGELLRLRGTVSAEVDSNNQQIQVSLDPGQEVVPNGNLVVQLFDETLILDLKTRSPLQPADLKRGDRVLVEGVLDLNSMIFRAATVLVKRPDDAAVGRLSGVIHAVDPANTTLEVALDSGRTVGVEVENDTVILKLTINGGLEVELIVFDQLQIGDRVVLFGELEDDHFDARVILVEENPVS